MYHQASANTGVASEIIWPQLGWSVTPTPRKDRAASYRITWGMRIEA